MITASEFLTWCEVFHVATGGNPPTTVSLQVAYDNSSPKQIDISAGNLNFINGTFGINMGTANPNASFQVDSTTQGTLPFPRMSVTDESALGTTLDLTDSGLMVYNTDFQSVDQWDGTQFLNMLTVGKVLPGANVSIINNGDGTIAIAATSGPSAVTSGQCNFYISNNAMDTVFSAPFTATPILSDNMHVIYQNNFNGTLVADSFNVNFLTAALRQIKVDAVFTLRTSSVLTQTYSIYLVIAGSPSLTTPAITTVTLDPGGAPGPQEISLTYNLPVTGPSESIQFWISNDSATADPVVILRGAVTILDTSQFGGFASTDNLAQGALNWYASQDGGTTFQNVNALPVVVGNVATFNTVGGKLQDSGLALSGFVKQGDSGIYFGITPPTSLVSPKMLNLYAAGTAGANAQNWYNDTDNYPLLNISPLNHDSIDLNFDCYYDGSFLRASTGAIAWQINKSSGHLNFLYGTGAQGNIISTTLGMEIDSAGRVTIPQGGNLETLRLGTSSSALNTTTPAISFSANYGAGNLLNLAGSGRNIGFQTGLMFLTYNANYNAGIATYQVSSSGDVFVAEIGSAGIALKRQQSGVGGATASLSTSFLLKNDGFIQLPYLTNNSSLLAVDSGRNVDSATGFYTLGGLTFNNGGSGGPLLGTVAPMIFAPVLSDGDYISLGGSGRNIGVTSAGTGFLSYNLDWDGGLATYKFNGTGNAFTVEVGPSGIFFKSATSGSAGTPIVPAIGFQMQAAGAIDIPFVTDNTIMARVSGTITTASGGSFDLAQLMLNSVAPPTLTQAARLNIVGNNTTTNSSINLYTQTDGFPLVNLVAYAHGTQYLNFDCYFDGTFSRSSYSGGSNFRLNKSFDLFVLECEAGVAQGSTISWVTAWTADSLGKFYVNSVSASSIVATDGSGAFTSVPSYGITARVVVTGSSQAMAVNTRYINNYSGGQCAYTLPAATGSGKQIVLVSLTTASTSGWKITANGTDKIQFMGALGAAGSTLTSTVGSAVDCATLTDEASGLWVVYPAAGLNLTVA